MLDWLIPTAHAMASPQGGGQAGGGGALMQMAPLVIIVVIFYLMIIRPQQKRQKEHKNLLDNLKKGDKVVTSGGIYGEVFALTPDVVTLVIADNVKVKVARGYISGLASQEQHTED